MESSRSAAADRLFRVIRKEFPLFGQEILAAAIAVIVAAIAAAIGIVSAAEPENQKNDDDPTAAAAISKIKSTVHKKRSL